MEKKNMVLLTVIAVATLLVAVVGATFAYFTATVTTTNDVQKGTSVTTETMTNVVMTYGTEIKDVDMFPGYKNMRTVLVTGTGKDGAADTYVDIDVTANIPEAFSKDVTWKIYQIEGNATETYKPCVNSKVETPVVSEDGTNETHYTSSSACVLPTGTPVMASSDAAGKRDLIVKVPVNTESTYVLVVEYADNQDQTAAQAGQSFDFTIGASATNVGAFDAAKTSGYTATNAGAIVK